jgi:hypothetical protein
MGRTCNSTGGAEPYKKSRYCSSRRKKAKGQTKTKMGGRRVDDAARKLGERNWRNAARNKDSWQKLLRKALAQKSCCDNDDYDADDVCDGGTVISGN